jgi:hypothetical protein
VIEVSNRRFREWLEERRHALLPLLITDYREPFDVCEVFCVELDVFPHRSGVPAMETSHIEQHAQFSMLPEESLELRHEVPVICLYQLSADVNNENLPAVFFIELNGHWGSFGSFSRQVTVHGFPAYPPFRVSLPLHFQFRISGMSWP